MATISFPIRLVMLIQTRDLAHFLSFVSHEHDPNFYRLNGEILLHVEVIGYAPGTGGDGPGPDITGVEIEVNEPSALYFLGHYWGQRELRLRQLEGALDNMLLAWQKQHS